MNCAKTEQESVHKNYGLNTYYQFNNFIEGESNRIAKMCAMKVAEFQGQPTNNPFLLYSEPGLGKTHLLMAIFNKIKVEKPECRITYFNCCDFVSQYVNAIRSDTKEHFYNAILEYDVLLIDDINYLSEKKKNIEFFVSLFDTYICLGKQIILTTSEPIDCVEKFGKRFITRIKAGLTITIQEPDSNTMLKILKNKFDYLELEISEEVLEFIVNFEKDLNPRVLQGLLISVVGKSSLMGKKLTVDLIKSELKKMKTAPQYGAV
jgi:chromosomal replication initiator protein